MLLPRIFLSGLFFIVSVYTVSAQETIVLKELPVGDRWFGVFMSDERVGFARGTTSITPGGYEFSGEGSEKMTGMFARESVVHEQYSTDGNLSLKSFTILQTLNGVSSKTSGEVIASGLRISYESKGVKKEKILKHQGPIYPPTALNVFPLLRGATPGKSYRLSIIEPEDRKIKNVRVSVVGFENDAGKKVVHLRHNRYPFSTDVWIDAAGNTVKESVRDGWIVTAWEEEASALRNLSEAAVAKKNYIEVFSRVPAEPGLKRVNELKKLVVAVSGLPASFQPAPGSYQSAQIADRTTVFTLENPPANRVLRDETEALRKYLERAGLIDPGDPGVIEKVAAIAAGETDPLRLVEKLTHWVSKNLRETQADTLPPQQSLRTGSGNCQSHVLLYVSLARAAGIPTKYVSGLVYLPERGFVFHCWAESYAGRWLPVDPTTGQVPADLTHITLAEGYSPGSQILLGSFVGKLRVRVLEQIY